MQNKIIKFHDFLTDVQNIQEYENNLFEISSFLYCMLLIYLIFWLQLNTKRAAKNLMLSEGTAWTDVSAMKTATQKLSGKAVMCQY